MLNKIMIGRVYRIRRLSTRLPVIAALTIPLFLFGCNSNKENREEAGSDELSENASVLTTDSVGTEIHAGKQLVDTYCTRCHLAPEPGDLPREVWPLAVSWMSHYVGFSGDEIPGVSTEVLADRARSENEIFFQISVDGGLSNLSRLFSKFILPAPIMSEEDLLTVLEYYVSNSSEESGMKLKRDAPPEVEGFEAISANLGLPTNGIVYSTLVDEEEGILYVAKGGMNIAESAEIEIGVSGSDGNAVLAFDIKNGEMLGMTEFETRPMTLEFVDDAVRVGIHGVVPGDPENGEGRVVDLVDLAGGRQDAHMLVNGFSRIVQSHTKDLDNDGRADLIVNGFGDGILHVGAGRLSVYWQTPEYSRIWESSGNHIPNGPLAGALEELVLMERAGIISSVVADVNNDGLQDVIALTAQGRHELIVFVNEGDRVFKQRVVKKWRPSVGSIRVNAADINNDGLVDLLIMTGNNVELVTTRPQHGVRVFENMGDFDFEERYFYPLPGAINAVTYDFDNDGDQDIAAISLWPDWELDVPESFVYLENEGDWQFSSFSLPAKDWGVWVSMSVGDVNADDKADIILGLGHFPFFRPHDWKELPIVEKTGSELPAVTYLLNNF